MEQVAIQNLCTCILSSYFSQFKPKKNQQEASHGTNQQPLPGPGTIRVYITGGPVVSSARRATLPPALWPHNFLWLSCIVLITLGILNPFTLVTSIPAVISAIQVSLNFLLFLKIIGTRCVLYRAKKLQREQDMKLLRTRPRQQSDSCWHHS